MNAKELRRAANEVCPLESDAAISLANHILSTVREDDDERFTSEWATSFPIAKLGMIELSEGESIDIARDGSVWLSVDDSFSFDHIKTRGDFRALCRLLGVTLKE